MKAICTRCGAEWSRKKRIDTSVPFVCRDCRCVDCQAILDFECACGNKHTQRSRDDPALCRDCSAIRLRVSILPARELKERLMEFKAEKPLY